MASNSVLWRAMAAFSNSAVRHNAEARGGSVMQQSAPISNSCVHVTKLTLAPIENLKQMDGYRRQGFLPVYVTSKIDSEEQFDNVIQNTEVTPETPKKGRAVTGTGSILEEILEEARRQSAASLWTLTQAAVGISERPFEVMTTPAPEMRSAPVIEQPEFPGDVPLPRSFLAEAVDGNLVECSGGGCRPFHITVLAEYFQLTYYTGGSLTEADSSAVKEAFHVALESAPCDARLVSEFAMFTWKSLGDVAAAEEFYNKALELAPHDPYILAGHAFFLWRRAT